MGNLVILVNSVGCAAAGPHIASESIGTVLRGLAILVEGITVSLINIAVFRVTLPAVGLAAPQILQDVTMAIAYLLWAFVLLRSKVAELGPGNFFGEWALLTGAPRQATVIARTEVNAYRLDKESFQETIRARPAIAEGISTILAQRRTELEASLENLDAQARALRLAREERDILGKIRHLFGLANPTNG